MAGFVVKTVEEENKFNEGLTILARIFSQNILKELAKANSSRNEVAYARFLS